MCLWSFTNVILFRQTQLFMFSLQIKLFICILVTISRHYNYLSFCLHWHNWSYDYHLTMTYFNVYQINPIVDIFRGESTKEHVGLHFFSVCISAMPPTYRNLFYSVTWRHRSKGKLLLYRKLLEKSFQFAYWWYA